MLIKRRLGIRQRSKTTSSYCGCMALLIVTIMVVILAVWIMLNDNVFIAVLINGSDLNRFIRLCLPDAPTSQALLKRAALHEYLLLIGSIRVNIENIAVRYAGQYDLRYAVSRVNCKRIPNGIFKRRELRSLRIEPVLALLVSDRLFDLRKVVLRLPSAGKLLGNALRVYIDFIPNVIPHGKAAVYLNDLKALIGRNRRFFIDLRRLFQHGIHSRMVAPFKPLPDGGNINIGEIIFLSGFRRHRRGGRYQFSQRVLDKSIFQPVGVLWVIEVHPHKVRILNGQGGPLHSGFTLHTGSCRVRVSTGIAVRIIFEHTFPHDRVKGSIAILCGHE